MDSYDIKILEALQKEGDLSQRALAEHIGLSQNACWRRVQKLRDTGVLKGTHAKINAKAAGLKLTTFVMLRTRSHNKNWAQNLKSQVEAIPEIVEMHRIGGEWDYLLKVITTDMEGYDQVYQQLIAKLDLDKVTGLFSMETVLENRPLALKIPT